MQIARRRGLKKAIVALARRLAVVHAPHLVDGTEFRWTREHGAAREPSSINPERRKLELHLVLK